MTEEAKRAYAGIYLLKRMDLTPSDGGLILPVVLPSDLSPLEDILMELAVEGLVEINRRKDRWELTRKGLAYLASLIDEAEALIDEFDDDELPDVVAELRARNLDVFRARFLWGWFDGELDDLAQWQQQRGVTPVETLWAYYLLDDAFYAELAKDLATG
ncbi:MAG TPA: hypothetical protein VM261_27625 [Kofleriaceae bacterium]|nr:hypothetical protein [Kofleriaceae bacterium]